MTKRLDPATRRTAIADAVLRLADRGGLDTATVRVVAAEAGVSAGMVQHYFTTRDEMLRFACELMIERISQRTGERLAALPQPVSNRGLLRAMLAELLPTSEERKSIIRVWMAFLQRAVVQTELATYLRETHERTQAAIRAILERARDSGELTPGLDLELETTALFAQVDGLVSHVYIGHYTGDEAHRVIDAHLDRLFRDAL